MYFVGSGGELLLYIGRTVKKLHNNLVIDVLNFRASEVEYGGNDVSRNYNIFSYLELDWFGRNKY